jgi:hypothetical protein
VLVRPGRRQLPRSSGNRESIQFEAADPVRGMLVAAPSGLVRFEIFSRTFLESDRFSIFNRLRAPSVVTVPDRIDASAAQGARRLGQAPDASQDHETDAQPAPTEADQPLCHKEPAGTGRD